MNGRRVKSYRFGENPLKRNTMNYSLTISLDCPHCVSKCQFKEIADGVNYLCKWDECYHVPYYCTHCHGVVSTIWYGSYGPNLNSDWCLHTYYPRADEWKPRIDPSVIQDDGVRADFKEAIGCYNSGFFNACMIMARRAIQQEMTLKDAQGNNLYDQIQSMGISSNLKALLQKIKNFGNSGAHPDFALYDNEGNKIENKKEFAELTLQFLDRYLSDQYEIDDLVQKAPKSEKELGSQD